MRQRGRGRETQMWSSRQIHRQTDIQKSRVRLCLVRTDGQNYREVETGNLVSVHSDRHADI